jgi:hypothetical protein
MHLIYVTEYTMSKRHVLHVPLSQSFRQCNECRCSELKLQQLTPAQAITCVNLFSENSRFESGAELGLPELNLSVFSSGLSGEFWDSIKA